MTHSLRDKGIVHRQAAGIIAFLLLIVLAGVWAAEPASGTENPQALYEISLTRAPVSSVQVSLPAGWEFAGLAPGSQVAAPPSLSPDGRVLTWAGPFSASTIRFWLAPTVHTAVAPDRLDVVGAGAALRLDPAVIQALYPAANPPAAPARPLTATIEMTKTVTPLSLTLRDNMWVTYEVLFTNAATMPVTLDRITDTLPDGFLFGNPAVGDQVGQPLDREEPVIVWGSVTVPASGTLTQRYHVRAVERGGEYVNRVEAVSGGERFGPVSATLTVEGNLLFLPLVNRNYTPPAPEWHLTKSSNSDEIDLGGTVDYTALIENRGNLTGTLETISDALPEGMTFVGMLPDSDITSLPLGTTGTIWWTGPWTVPPGGTLSLRYQCRADSGGEKTNTVSLYSSGQTVGTASHTVLVGGGLPVYEDFTYSAMENWEIFLNYPDLLAERWYWSGEDGVWGLYNYEFDRVSTYQGYALAVYKDPAAQSWTDYRVEARLKDVKEYNLNKGLSGIWFRGLYDNSGNMDGKTVAGYYFYIKPGNDTLYLMRTPPDNPMFASQTVVASYVYGPGIGRKHWYNVEIEVRGNHIQIWFGDETDGMIPVFDWIDPDNAWQSGTVGLSVYNSSARFDYVYVLPLP
ncbi:MAG TPA: DUF11 domain-containing protein [Anaerolineae bacterium]|nr:DUF11 domain-containing protein [Anaerolineae bacterium]